MISIITCAAVLAVILFVPRLLVALLTILIGAALFSRSRSVAGRLLADSSIRIDMNYDRRPTRAERRLIRKGLRLALAQTEVRSLFPSITARVERWTVPA